MVLGTKVLLSLLGGAATLASGAAVLNHYGYFSGKEGKGEEDKKSDNPTKDGANPVGQPTVNPSDTSQIESEGAVKDEEKTNTPSASSPATSDQNQQENLESSSGKDKK